MPRRDTRTSQCGRTLQLTLCLPHRRSATAHSDATTATTGDRRRIRDQKQLHEVANLRGLLVLHPCLLHLKATSMLQHGRSGAVAELAAQRDCARDTRGEVRRATTDTRRERSRRYERRKQAVTGREERRCVREGTEFGGVSEPHGSPKPRPPKSIGLGHKHLCNESTSTP